MALTLLQPGMEPLGQFDLVDGATPVGGELATFGAAAGVSAADVWGGLLTCALGGPDRATNPGAAAAVPSETTQAHGLVDDGGTGYGTLFGSVIGGTVGQGTGFGVASTVGVVVVGPNTSTGSGKVTLWCKPGLYGSDDNAWVAAADSAAATLNDNVYSVPAGAVNALAGTTGGTITPNAGSLLAATDTSQIHADLVLDVTAGNITDIPSVGLFLGVVNDTSLVSTTTTAVGLAATAQTNAMLFLGNGGRRG